MVMSGWAAAFGFFFVSAGHAQEPVTLASPNGNVRVTIAAKAKPGTAPGGRRLYYVVQHSGSDVLRDSPFELDFKGAPPFASGLAIQDVRRRAGNGTWQRAWGRRKHVRDHFNEVTLTLQEQQAPRRSVDLVFRAYDDGVAFRYVLPESWGRFALSRERSAFVFAGEPTVWAANYGGFHSSQEGEFLKRPLAQLKPDSVYGLPMLVRLAPSRWAAVTEADLTDWAGMHLSRAQGHRKCW